MLKPIPGSPDQDPRGQPPSGGCVLKPSNFAFQGFDAVQPPSGGCVLKPAVSGAGVRVRSQPPSGGCVLKQNSSYNRPSCQHPAAFGRLCVETNQLFQKAVPFFASRLRAAVC